jgi:hypothetical protein
MRIKRVNNRNSTVRECIKSELVQDNMPRRQYNYITHVSLARIVTEVDEGPKTTLLPMDDADVDDTALLGELSVKAVVPVVATTARMARESFIVLCRATIYYDRISFRRRPMKYESTFDIDIVDYRRSSSRQSSGTHAFARCIYMTDDARTTNTHATYFKAPGGTILGRETRSCVLCFIHLLQLYPKGDLQT